MTTAKLTDLIMTDMSQLQLFGCLPIKYVHSDSPLTEKRFQWNGCLTKKEIQDDDIIVAVDAFAYRQRHQETGRIVRIRCGGYTDSRKEFRSLKLAGVVRGKELFIVVEPSNDRMSDINDLSPVRVSGVYQALKATYRLQPTG